MSIAMVLGAVAVHGLFWPLLVKARADWPAADLATRWWIGMAILMLTGLGAFIGGLAEQAWRMSA